MVEVELLDHTPDPEKVIERTMLITRNLWPNIPYENKTLEERINLLWKRKHFGCFEKAYVTILAMKLSRVCTHQLVRHRIASYSQQSQRYVKEGDFVGGYSEFAKCGLSPECAEDHTLVTIYIAPGDHIINANPADWYTPTGTFPPEPTR